MNNIKFSILIPAYKQKYLYEAVKSCLMQTYENLELIIVDDASPENLRAVVEEFHDSRIKYYRNNSNFGAINVVDNWNKCLSYAQGDYVICMGDDDILLPNCLEEYSKLIKKFSNIGLLHGWTEIINEKSIPTKITCKRCEYESVYSLIWHRLNVYSYQYIGDFCFKRDLLIKDNGFLKLPLAWGSDDISSFIAASHNGVANTQSVVFQYRVNSMTISKSGDANLKMEACVQFFNWLKRFLEKPASNHSDEMFRLQILNELGRHINEKKTFTIMQDLESHKFCRVIYWLMNKRKWKITYKSILLAIERAYL